MENPLDSGDSKPQDQKMQAEGKAQDLNEQTEDNKPQDLSEQTEESKPQDLSEQIEESKPQDLNEQTEDSKPLDLSELTEDSKPQDLDEQAKEQMETPMEMPEQRPQDEEPFPLSSSRKMSMTVQEDEVHSASAPELITTTFAHLEQGEDNKLQDLEKQTKESMETSMETSEQQPQSNKEKERPQPIYESQRAKAMKKQKTNVAFQSNCANTCNHASLAAKPMFPLSRSGPPKALLQRVFIPKPKPQTADKATQLRAIPIFPLRLPEYVRPLSRRDITPKPLVKPPATNNTTQISRSFERLIKKPPPLVKMKKNEGQTTAKIPSVKTTSSNFQKETSSQPASTVKQAPPPLKKRSTVKQASQSLRKRSTAIRIPQPLQKHAIVKQAQVQLTKYKRPQVVYNLYLNLCDHCRNIDPCCFQRTRRKGRASCSGLSKACTVFSILKSGGIHVDDLLLALQTLGILVTHNEMHEALRLVNVNANGILNFSEFLEVVNTTSPFAETDALQNTLRAFRKIKKGLVAVRDLESVLTDLGVNLSDENVQQILRSMRISKKGKLDLSAFLLAAKELRRSFEEEESLSECLMDPPHLKRLLASYKLQSQMDSITKPPSGGNGNKSRQKQTARNEHSILERRPFQDVANLVSVDSRWRRKYQDSFDEEMGTLRCLFPLTTWPGSDEDITVAKQQRRISQRPSTVPPENNAEVEDKDPNIIEVKKSLSLTGVSTDQGELSTASSIHKERIIAEVSGSQLGFTEQKRPTVESPARSAEGDDKGGNVVKVTES